MKSLQTLIFILLLISSVFPTSAQPIPTGFYIPNLGQWKNEILFATYDKQSNLFVTNTSVFIDYFQLESNNNVVIKHGQNIKFQLSSVNFANPIFLDESPWYLNFFIGTNKSNWVSKLHGYSSVLFKNILPLIDLNFRFDNSFPRYDFIVQPGGDPSLIKFKFEGADNAYTDGKNIYLTTRFGEMVNGQLYSYQIDNKQEIAVEAYFIQSGDKEFSIKLGNYDPNKVLIIDPILTLSYFGGSGNDEFVDGKEISTGKLLTTGWTESPNFPTTPGAYDTTLHDGSNVFVSLFDMTYSRRELVFSTFLGGASIDYPVGLGFDGENNIYLSGTTNSSDFPIINSVGSSINGGFDIFVTKMTSDGVSLIFSTFLGGNKDDIATVGKLAPDKGFFVTGYTTSTNFPTTGGAYQSTLKGRKDIFLIKLSSSGRTIDYATYIGGGDDDEPYGMAVTPSGNIFIVGRTKSSDFPIVPYRTGQWGVYDSPYDRSYNGGWDAFAIKMLGDGGKIDFSTYFGGTADDIARVVTYTQDETIIFAGETYKETVSQPTFPISSNPFQSTLKGGAEIFITKLSNIITSSIGGYTRRRQDLLFSTFIGGSANDFPISIELLKNNSIALAGHTNSTNFPIVNNPTGKKIGKYDLFYVNMTSDGSNVNFSDLFGTAEDDSTKSFIITPNGDLYFLAVTNSRNATTINPIKGTSYGGLLDGLLIKFSSADLRLDNPVGKETWCPNTTVNIRWGSEVFNSNDTFNLEIKRSVTGDWETLASNIKGLNYNWTIPPSIFGEELWLRVSHKRGLIASNSTPFTIYQLPEITSTGSIPQSSTFCEGDSITLWISALGSKLKYQWFFNNQIIQGKTDSLLVIKPLTITNSGSYKVIVSGPCPTTVESNPFIISVIPSTKVLSQSNDTTVKIDQTLYLYVLAKGDSLKYQWFKDGNKLLGQTKNFFQIDRVSKSDKGIYYCKVQGLCGSDSTQPIMVDIDTILVNVTDNFAPKIRLFLDQNQNSLEIYYKGEKEQVISIDLIDMLGNRIQLRNSLPIHPGDNYLQLPLISLPSGIYYTLFSTEQNRLFEKLIISR